MGRLHPMWIDRCCWSREAKWVDNESCSIFLWHCVQRAELQGSLYRRHCIARAVTRSSEIIIAMQRAVRQVIREQLRAKFAASYLGRGSAWKKQGKRRRSVIAWTQMLLGAIILWWLLFSYGAYISRRGNALPRSDI